MSAPDPNRLTEELRRTADAATPRPVDVDAVLGASRARRRSRRTAALGATGAAATLLVVGGLVLALQPTGGGVTTAEAPVASETSEPADASGGEALETRLAPPEKVNACGLGVAPPTDASSTGLTVTVEAAEPVASGSTGDVLVRVVNVGGAPVAGELRAVPAVAIAEDGVTRWHTNGSAADEFLGIELAPGDSIELSGAIEAVACTEADEALESFPEDLPALAPGDYGVTAVVMLVDAATGAIHHLVAPLAPLTIE
jgi:hypothetical protein